MKLSSFLFFFFLSQVLLSQIFISPVTITPIDSVQGGPISFVDIDNDLDLDVLIFGIDNFGSILGKLYKNKGQGSFEEVSNTPFNALYDGDISIADIDNDQDIDILTTGRDQESNPLVNLYLNDGLGNYVETQNHPFLGVFFSAVAFGDIDGDNDQDVLITGRDSSNVLVAKLYENDGIGGFTEILNDRFKGVEKGDVSFADIDNDQDLDLLISGASAVSETGAVTESISKIYLNDGHGDFMENLDIRLPGVVRSKINFFDMDNDLDLDLYIQSTGLSTLYRNDGQGLFTEVSDNPFIPLFNGDAVILDADLDGDLDIFSTGRESLIPRAILFQNDGTGDFAEISGLPFEGVYNSSIAAGDVDNDGDQDLLVTGRKLRSPYVTQLYLNTSEVVSNIDFVSNNSPDVVIYPNPSHGGNVFIDYNSMENERLTIFFRNLNGQLLGQLKTPIQRGLNKILLEPKHLKEGLNYLEFRGEKTFTNAKLIVHKN